MFRLCAALFAISLEAQTQVAVPFSCTPADIDFAGLSCTEAEPCPVYVEISHVYGRGNKVIATGNLHSSTVTLYSLLLQSDDGGLSWTEPFARQRGATLDRALFVDDKTGWIAGQTMVPVPKDPFLLLTSDGGKTWRLQPVLEDDSPGSVLQFGFEDARHGVILLDRGTEGNRYELHESLAGGASWSIRSKTTKPPALPAWAAAEPGDWRAVADARAKAYAVERRQGENWSRVATIPVLAGQCRPAPVAEPAPPSTTQTETAEPAKDYVEELHLGGTPPPKKKKPKK